MNVLLLFSGMCCVAAPPPGQVGHLLGLNRAWLVHAARNEGEFYSGYWSAMEGNPTILFPVYRSDVVYFIATRQDVEPPERHYLTSFRRSKRRAVRQWQVVLLKYASSRRPARPDGSIARLLYDAGLAVSDRSGRKVLRVVGKAQALARYEIAEPIGCVWSWFVSANGSSSQICEQPLGKSTGNLNWCGFPITPMETSGLRRRMRMSAKMSVAGDPVFGPGAGAGQRLTASVRRASPSKSDSSQASPSLDPPLDPDNSR